MNHAEKEKILQTISEEELRRDILIPLLSKMGFYSPIEYHGANEKGKDIICYDYNKLGERDFLSVVAKANDLTGSVSSNKGLHNIIFQVQQTFGKNYDELLSMKEVWINQVWIITSGKISPGAEDSIVSQLRNNNNLDKRVKIISGSQLVTLIDKHFDTYWNSSAETKESVIIQRDRILAFFCRILKEFGAEQSAIDNVKNQLLNSSTEPSLIKVNEGYFFTASYANLEIGEIDPLFDENIPSYDFGNLRKQFSKVKERFKYEIWEVEEIVDKGRDIMLLTSPDEFIKEFEDKLDGEYPFNSSLYRDKFKTEFEYLKDGFADIQRFKLFLSGKNNLEWYKECAQSILLLKPHLSKVLELSQGMKAFVQFGIVGSKVEVIEAKSSNDILFTIDLDRERDVNKHIYGDKPITLSELIDLALWRFRKYIEERDNYSDWLDTFDN